MLEKGELPTMCCELSCPKKSPYRGQQVKTAWKSVHVLLLKEMTSKKLRTHEIL